MKKFLQKDGRITVGSKHPNITKEYFSRQGVIVNIIKLNGFVNHSTAQPF